MAENSKGYSPVFEQHGIDLPEQKKTETTESFNTDSADTSEPQEAAKNQSEDFKTEPENSLPVQKISLKLYDVEIAAILRTMARASDLNMMISERIKGKISIHIDESPWDEVFRSILHTYGLTYDWDGNIIRVLTLEDISHEMKLLEAKQEILAKKREAELRHLETEQKKASKKIEIEMFEPLHTRIVQIKYSDVKNLQKNLEQFLTGDKEKKRGSIAVDEHTNALIIQATQSDLKTITSLIDVLDSPSLQILIEAHIVETNQDTARDLGIQWGGLYHRESGNSNYWITPGANSWGSTGQTDGDKISPTSGMAVNFPAALPLDAGFNLGYAAQKIGNYILSVQLSALQKQGKLNILSSPSITTLDNQRALIESGKEVPYQSVEDGEVNTEFKKATLKLEVTPHVIDDKTLKMKISTQKDEVDTSVRDNPPIITKKAETNVVLFDGQTTVIGGLSKESSSKSETGVPCLKDIPVIGHLFKGSGNSTNMEEVLIFITPYILKKQKE